MNKQQTAIEWFAEATAKLGYVSTDILNQAKAMEKEQIKEAYSNGQVDDFKHRAGIGDKPNKENYYNQTYNQ